MSKNYKKLFIGFSIFIFVFISFTFAIKGYGWCVDDLGVILNGLISDFSSFCRVFSEDMRNYASTYNYNLPQPNFISGFLRPMEQVFFSITYHLFGTNILAFHLLQSFFHAANALLIFMLFCNWFSFSLASFGALLFAFYPNTTWLTWICTLQHSLTLFFLLVAILLYLPLVKRKAPFYTQPLFYLSGISFLFSLLSRETHIFLAPWAFLGVFLFYTPTANTFFSRVVQSFSKTWIFFLATITYVCMRLHVFGLASLVRTARNVLIRFPFLAKFFSVSPITSQIAAPTTTAPEATTVTPQVVKAITQSCTPSRLSILQNKFFLWVNTILNVQTNTLMQKAIVLSTIILLFTILFIAYRKQKSLLFFLLAGIPLFIWPCILVYPASRYMNTTYPYLIFIVLLGIYLLLQKKKTFFTKSIITIFFLISTHSLIHGFRSNIVRSIKSPPASPIQKCYIDFFTKNKFPRKSNFIFISTLDEADLEQVLQVASNDFELKAAHVVISKLAHKGQYGFTEGYSRSGYKCAVTPIPMGYRFKSLDRYHCGWTFHSYQPVIWSEKERAYVLAPEFFKESRWYKFSMGKFFIHEITNKKYVTDVSFVFDKKWIIPNTFFVSWDTIESKYRVLDSSHIQQIV